jgi:hypothetical protein
MSFFISCAQYEEVVGLAANATTAMARGGPTWIATTVSSGEDPILKFTKGKVSQVKTYICKHDESKIFLFFHDQISIDYSNQFCHSNI